MVVSVTAALRVAVKISMICVINCMFKTFAESTYPCCKKCLKLLFQIFQNVSITMWATVVIKRRASYLIPKKIVKIKTAATKSVPTDTEEDADLAKVAEEKKFVNLFTSQNTVIVIFLSSKPRLRA